MATSTRGARYFKDFKRYDPRIFNGTSKDPTVAEMWVLSMENIFRLMNCPDDRKVSFASFMLQGDAELWWEFTREILSPNGGVITWLEFREAFWAKYNSDEARLRKQQEFTQLTQSGRSVTTYAREFMRLKRFALELVDTELKLAQRFILGLDQSIRGTVKAINPTTYAAALRAAKAMDGNRGEELREPPTPIAVGGQKRQYNEIDPHCQLPMHPQQTDGYRRDLGRGQQLDRRRVRGWFLARTRACFRCGQEGHIAMNCLERHIENPPNQLRDLGNARRTV
ncbi:uncharacterized protein LOC111792490 [Cucurbita pepo subsp. pepo]|uniref:uncharacterized protein LOC111792490 n=1 Tax=Cucurbita pepo subsp. pepo TaxID=3664 RepID=UPI000C9D7B38|nr:uncharacterized protein LOC111792490 [Cucurbita pepo subsp. pepo]